MTPNEIRVELRLETINMDLDVEGEPFWSEYLLSYDYNHENQTPISILGIATNSKFFVDRSPRGSPVTFRTSSMRVDASFGLSVS